MAEKKAESGKYIALWNFKNDYEGDVKAGDELILNAERARELLRTRMVRDKAKYQAGVAEIKAK